MSGEEDAPDANPLSPSVDSSAPPSAHGHALPAQQLSSHPVWAAARGGGGSGVGSGRWGTRGRSRAPGRVSRPASEAGDNVASTRFERISMAELEARQYADGDGADSTIQSDDDNDNWERVRSASGNHRKRQKAPHNEHQSDGDLDDDADEDQDDQDDQNGHHRKRLAGLMGAAAFGGVSGGHYRANSDAGSMLASETSSQHRRDAMRDAFPVRGVSCVGCALANRIGPVNRFVRDNISQMTEDTLWKMAALCYKREVAEPTEREGAPVPAWGWKEVRVHYELHSTSNLVARHKMLRQLQCMRQQQEQRLVRVDNGEKELDRQSSDMMLKIIAAESRERQLLDAQLGGKGKRD